jgi:hypothetical protein
MEGLFGVDASRRRSARNPQTLASEKDDLADVLKDAHAIRECLYFLSFLY